MTENIKSSRQISTEARNRYVCAMELLGTSPKSIAAAKGELPLNKPTLRRRLITHLALANLARLENH